MTSGLELGKIFAPLRWALDFILKKYGKWKGYFEIFWKNSRDLQPKEVLGPIRSDPRYGFQDYYYRRGIDEEIIRQILSGGNVLVVGPPLSGKTRAIYQALKALPPGRDVEVIIPRAVDVNPEDFSIPPRLFFWRSKGEKVLILDDLDKFLNKRNFVDLIKAFLNENALIVATCRDGAVYRQVQQVMERELVIFVKPLAIGRVSRQVGEEIAQETGRSLPATFDGTVGSIFLKLDAMQARFREAALEEKAVLRSLKRLYYAGLYQGRDLFSQDQVQRLAQAREGLEKKPYEWTPLMQSLKDKNFLEILEQGLLAVEEVYL